MTNGVPIRCRSLAAADKGTQLPLLSFDPAAHVYHWGGTPVPNVTRILAPLTDYSRIPPDVLERARQEGAAIHRMVELDCKGSLDVDALMTAEGQEWLRPYYAAWRKFVDETGFELWESEQRVYHKTFAYAGTLDLTGLMPKIRLKAPALLDIKRSFYAGGAIGVQISAYEKARNSAVDKALRTESRFGLQLRKDANYRLEPFEDRDDFGVFLACLTTLRWKEKHP